MTFVLYNHIGSGNHGCEALVRTLAELLGRENTMLLSERPEEEEKYGITNLIKVRNALNPVNKKSADFAKAYLKLKISGDYFSMDALPYYKAIDSLNKSDILVSIGGDIYCYDNYPKYIQIHQHALKRIPDSILLGCSVEPDSLKDKKLVNDLKSYKLITARESITYHALKDAGIDQTVYCPDSAFLLKTERTELPSLFRPGNTVGLNISPLVLKRSGNDHLILDNYKELIKYIITTTDQNIALIPHVVWKDNDDRIPLQQLYDEFKDTNRICMVKDQNAEKLKFIISQCSSFVGARTHATIAAYSTGVPTLVLGYSVKSKGIARDLFGTEENYVIPYPTIQQTDDLLNRYKWIQLHANDIHKQLTIKSEEYKQILKSEFQKVSAIYE